jgi:hypothetical protein
MAIFITNKGGTNKFVVEFVISSDYLKLRIDVGISLLDNTSSYLSIDALDFFRLWYTQPYVTKGFLYHISSYVEMVKNWAKEKGESEDSVVNLMKKFKVPSNVQEVLVPLHYANHRSVIVMNVSHFMHYDPLKSANVFQFARVHRFFAKMWVVT